MNHLSNIIENNNHPCLRITSDDVNTLDGFMVLKRMEDLSIYIY